MTIVTATEVALQAELDADNSNSWLRQVLADYLDDVGDPRSAGYRALGVCGKYSKHYTNWCYGSRSNPNCHDRNWLLEHDSCLLNSGWLGGLHRKINRYDHNFIEEEVSGLPCWRHFNSRQQADDAAAHAWLLLSEQEREQILVEARCKL